MAAVRIAPTEHDPYSATRGLALFLSWILGVKSGRLFILRENDFERLASTGVNTPGTMFPDSVPRICDFPEADFWPASLRVRPG